MVICEKLKKDKRIANIEEWESKCPPQRKDLHWKPGRSAVETAKYWLHGIPKPFTAILRSSKLNYLLCSPEYVSRFDAYNGNGRNHDLLLLAEDSEKKAVVISVESKVDESFGQTISQRIAAAKRYVVQNPNSKGLDRITELRMAVFGELNDNQLHLRYQLLTAIAGTIAEAKLQKASTAYFLVQTFVPNPNSKQHLNNQNDIDNFLNAFTKSAVSKIINGGIEGPFRIAGNNKFLSNEIDFWIGKYEGEI